MKLFVLLAFPAMASGFAFDIFSAFKPNPSLGEMVDAQNHKRFDVKFDIDYGKKNANHFYLNGLNIELLDTPATNKRTGLPGADGPNPKTSSGAKAANVVKNPHFIDMHGTQKVRFEEGCWEMVWKKDYYAGSIICGFRVPAGANRNGANLPAGRLYISFPVWTREGLDVRQSERLDAEERRKIYSEEKDEELRKYVAEANLFKKAMHYRNAAAAVEKLDMSGGPWLRSIPWDDEVVSIGSGLLMNKKGSVWTKDDNFFGAKHTHLGEAIIENYIEADEKDSLRP